MASNAKKRKAISLPITQFVAVIVLSISVFLIIDFGQRAATGYRVNQEEQELEAELLALQQTHQGLLNHQQYVQTDAYVEEIARNELKWSKPGETVVVIMPDSQTASPAEPPQPATTKFSPTRQTPLDAWLDLFFPQ